MLPAAVEVALQDPIYRRADRAAVSDALRRIGTAVPATFREFYETYSGPFGAERGYELMDLCEIEPTLVTLTEEYRHEFGWPPRYLVLSNEVGGAVLVLDAERDEVFNVDFEGGDELLLAGELPPEWPSFAAFLEEYFG